MVGSGLFFQFRGCAVRLRRFAFARTRRFSGQPNARLVNYSGFIIGLLLFLSPDVWRRNVNRRRRWLEQGSLLLLTAACAFGQFVITAKLSDLRGQIGRPIDEAAAGDPLRTAFNDWHGYSVTILMTAMIAAVIAFFLSVRRTRNADNL
jgi:hypothetical protein